MIYHLENEDYSVTVKRSGAELSSFRNKPANLEYIWQADPQVWPRHAPVLFPIVGKVPGGKYNYQGKTYELPQHGFARDMDFTLDSQSQTELVFALKESEQSLAVYPFPFRLQVTSKLVNNALEILYTVQNPGETDLYFSIGAHPGFNCPFYPGEDFADYYLEFAQPETQERFLLNEGLQNGQTEPVLQNQNTLPLTYELFQKDAIVFKNLASEKITLKTNKHQHSLAFEFKEFPFFGIWTKGPGAGFICLEPWHGIASRVGDSGELTQKEGIKKLAAGDNFTCSYTIRVN
jgi:galactose mutarotase-like enzyme